MSDWREVSPMAIRRDDQTISVAYVDGCTLYSLWAGSDETVFPCPHEILTEATKRAGSRSSNGRWALEWLSGLHRGAKEAME